MVHRVYVQEHRLGGDEVGHVTCLGRSNAKKRAV
jgi:hypothetical protein